MYFLQFCSSQFFTGGRSPLASWFSSSQFASVSLKGAAFEAA
jgi:hypothetical protein